MYKFVKENNIKAENKFFSVDFMELILLNFEKNNLMSTDVCCKK